MAEYKFRAECLDDVAKLHRTLSEKKVPVKMEISKKDPWFPEVDVYMEISGVSIDTLRQYMELEPDSHVMVETLTEAKRGKPAPVFIAR